MHNEIVRRQTELEMGAKMDDLAQRRVLEVDIDKLRRAKDPQAVDLAEDASRALKESKLEKAREIADRGLQIIAPKRLLEVLVTVGGVKSRAEARRAITAGGVRVDLKRAVDAEMDVKNAKSIKIGDKEILPQQ